MVLRQRRISAAPTIGRPVSGFPPLRACVRSSLCSGAFRWLTVTSAASTDGWSASGHVPLRTGRSAVEFDVSVDGFPEQGRQIAPQCRWRAAYRPNSDRQDVMGQANPALDPAHHFRNSTALWRRARRAPGLRPRGRGSSRGSPFWPASTADSPPRSRGDTSAPSSSAGGVRFGGPAGTTAHHVDTYHVCV